MTIKSVLIAVVVTNGELQRERRGRMDGSPAEEGISETKRRRNNHVFFVKNVPQDAKKSELVEVFSRYGRLRDVYMGVNMGENGHFFAFIRFADMKDVIAMERLLNRAKIRGRNLALSLARYERKKKEVYDTIKPLKTCNQPPQKKTSLMHIVTIGHMQKS